MRWSEWCHRIFMMCKISQTYNVFLIIINYHIKKSKIDTIWLYYIAFLFFFIIWWFFSSSVFFTPSQRKRLNDPAMLPSSVSIEVDHELFQPVAGLTQLLLMISVCIVNRCCPLMFCECNVYTFVQIPYE